MLFIGQFLHITNQEEVEEADRRHGEFYMIIEAENEQLAIGKFRRRLMDYRVGSDFFVGDCSIFMVQLLEFDRFPRDNAMVLNYKSTAGDPLMPFIGCSIPSHESDACRIYDWQNNRPEVDGHSERLFLQFRGDEPAPQIIEGQTQLGVANPQSDA